MDLIEIFKAGTHTDSSGNTREWTDKDLEEIASLYDPAKHEAPIVIGHPEHDSPAYGWVEGLKVEGGKLMAKVKDVADEFKDWVGRGLYKKISIALYPDLTLRHLGFLGAAIPAVKGLKQVSFSEKAEWTIESEFFCEAWQQETVKSIFQRMRDWMIDKFSLEEADKIISSYDIEALRYEPKESPVVTQSFSSEINNKGGSDMREWITKMREAIGLAEKELTPDPSIKFSEADIQAAETRGKDSQFAEMEKLKKEKSDLEKEKAEAAARTKEIETKGRNEGITAFCETLCKEGKLTPALRKIIEPVMMMVSNLPEASSTVQFAEGGPAVPAVKAIKDFLTELPKVVTFEEAAGGDGPNSGGSAAEKLSALTKKKMDADKNLSYGAAFSEVQKENLELARELLAEVRPTK